MSEVKRFVVDMNRQGVECVKAEDYDRLAAENERLNTDRKKCWEEFKALRRAADKEADELRAELEALKRQAVSPEHVWTHLLNILSADNSCDFISSTADFMQVRSDLAELIGSGFFRGNPSDMDGDYWLAAAGEQDEAEKRFPAEQYATLSAVLNRIFEGAGQQEDHTEDVRGMVGKQAQQEPVDGRWYWVEYEGMHAYTVPAMFKVHSKSWYTHQFYGVPASQIKVLGPCVRADDETVYGLVEALASGDKEAWKLVATTAHKNGVRYGTNAGMVGFLMALMPNLNALPDAPFTDTADSQHPEVAAAIASREQVVAQVKGLVEALEKLARLGNEPHYGNSVGNEIAREALAAHRAKGGE